MGIYTTILGLYKPDIDEVGWGALRNAAYDIIDTSLGTQHGLTGQHKFVTVDSGTGYITFPSLTTVQRNALPATNGMTIYNSTTNTLQSYQAGSWQNVIVSSITVEEQDFGPSISGVSTIRFPNGTVTDLGSGIASIAGFLQDSEGVAVGDVIYFDGSNWSRVPPGSSGQVFQTNGVGFAPTWVNPTSGGNVTAALSLTDNRIVRGDGGTVGVQTTGITVDDSNNVTGIVNLTTTGTVTHNGVTYTFPAADGTSGQFLQTNGAGVLAWASVGGGGNVSTTTIADNVLVRGDGGAQNIQGSGITISDTNDVSGVVNFTNTGTVTHNGLTYTFPASHGSSGFQLTNNGAGVLSWAASASSYRTSFTNATLVAGILTLTHSLGQQYVSVTIYDNNNLQIIPDEVTATSSSVATVDLTSFGTLTGTWNAVVLA